MSKKSDLFCMKVKHQIKLCIRVITNRIRLKVRSVTHIKSLVYSLSWRILMYKLCISVITHFCVYFFYINCRKLTRSKHVSLLCFCLGVFIVSAKRTPFGTYGGVLKDHSATDLAEHAAKAALAAGNVAPELVNSVIVGNVMQVRYMFQF